MIQKIPTHADLLQLLEQIQGLTQQAAEIASKVGLPLHDQQFLARYATSASGAVLRIGSRVAKIHGRRKLARTS